METLESLKRKIDSARTLQSIVKTMKALAAVNIRQYVVQGADNGYEIGNAFAPGHQRHDLHVGEARGPDAQAVRLVKAVLLAVETHTLAPGLQPQVVGLKVLSRFRPAAPPA